MADHRRPRLRGVEEDGDDSGGPAALERLRAEVDGLRSQIEEMVVTRQLVVVDDAGVDRARITTDSEGECRLVMLDDDGFERVQLTANHHIGTVALAGRAGSGVPTRVEMFALDCDEGDGAYVGVELVDEGNSVAGFVLYEGRRARTWTETGLGASQP